MADMTLLEQVKIALRISTDVFDCELSDLIESAKLDLGIAGVEINSDLDALVRTAVITYCKLHFGLPDDAERLTKTYWEQKAQLSTATGYTYWGDNDV